MIELKKLDGPFGIPVYHQQMPEMVRAASLGWLIFTGAADDTSIASPGLHHWFEHVPFRGTKKYPAGASDILGPFNNMNGYINAWTNHEATCYYGHVHDTQWKKALDVVTDMVANPLITDEGVEAERKVIHQEIAGSKDSAGGFARYELPGLLYPGHPFGHPVLGSEKTLAMMNAETLRRAHRLGYCRSRAVFFCVGNMSERELLDKLHGAAAELPSKAFEPRRKPYYFGPLPEWRTDTIEIETEFEASVVMMLFPTQTNEGETANMTESVLTYGLLQNMFEHGGMTSPLMRIVREERQLVYGCSTRNATYAGGGYFGFKATAKKENIPAIIEAFGDVMKDPALRSPVRLAEIKSGIRAEADMMPLDPDDYRAKAIGQFINCGGLMISHRAVVELMNKVTIDEVDAKLALLKPENARLVIFKGMGKS